MQAFRPVCCPTPWSSPLAVWSQLSYLTLRYFSSQFVEERLGLNLAKCFLTCLEQCVHWRVSVHLNHCLAKCLYLHLCLSACQCIDQRLASMMNSFSTSVLTSFTTTTLVDFQRVCSALSRPAPSKSIFVSQQSIVLAYRKLSGLACGTKSFAVFRELY